MDSIQSGVSKRKWFIVLGIAAVCALVTLGALEKLRQTVQCHNRLRVLEYQLMSYRLEHEGHYPPDILTMATFHSLPLSQAQTNNRISFLLRCPGRELHELSVSNALRESDYVYINWEALLGTNEIPGNYPLIYDKKMGSHWRLGINVLTKDARFWDFRGRRLRDFARKHPEYHLQLPE